MQKLSFFFFPSSPFEEAARVSYVGPRKGERAEVSSYPKWSIIWVVSATRMLDAKIRIREQEWARGCERGCREERMGGMVEVEGGWRRGCGGVRRKGASSSRTVRQAEKSSV